MRAAPRSCYCVPKRPGCVRCTRHHHAGKGTSREGSGQCQVLDSYLKYTMHSEQDAISAYRLNLSLNGLLRRLIATKPRRAADGIDDLGGGRFILDEDVSDPQLPSPGDLIVAT